MTAGPRLAVLVSLGSRNAEPAVRKKHSDDRNNGADTLSDRSRPVAMGEMMPASRDSADAIPHAVPLHRTFKWTSAYDQN